MATTSERTISLHVEPIAPEELLALVERTWSPLPDLNFERLHDWIVEGFRVVKVSWVTRYGPAYGGPAIFFALRNAEGKEMATMVALGEKVAEFIRQHLEGWQRNGIQFERWEFLPT